jgi:hypothetical protein
MADKQIELLERIAIALEAIANKLPTSIEVDNLNIKTTDQVTDVIAQTDDINPILNFLTSKNIGIKTFKTVEDADEVLDNIALFMGSRYNSVKKVYNTIKSRLTTGAEFRLDMKSETQEVVSYSCQFCTLLHQIAFLESYTYFKSPRFTINAKPNRIPTAINFLTGGWLERFIKTEVVNQINRINTPIKFSILANPQIVLPNGNDFELDFLLSVNDEIFWFEAKTGEYQVYVEKYSKMAKLLGLDNEHAFMVLTEVSEHNCAALKKVFGMNVVNIENFSSVIEKSIEHFQNRKEDTNE